MFFLDNWHKFALVAVVVIVYSLFYNINSVDTTIKRTEQSTRQLDGGGRDTVEHMATNNFYALGWVGIVVFSFLVFVGDLRKMFKSLRVDKKFKYEQNTRFI